QPQKSLRFSAVVFPTLHCSKPQTVISLGEYDFHINTEGFACLQFGGHSVSTGERLKLRHWYRIEATISNDSITVEQHLLGRVLSSAAQKTEIASSDLATNALPVVAARELDGTAIQHFNGKIEAPAIIVDDEVLCAWDFSRNMSSTSVPASKGPALSLVNFPARAMTGSAWDGSEMNWNHNPSHYAAIHFHEDDIYDFNWQNSFGFTIPDEMPSGVYVMHLECDGHCDALPFFVCAPVGKPKADLCVLVSTFTYSVYGNHARPDYAPFWQDRIKDWNAYPHNPAEYRHYGLSTYNWHSDGSGICHASHRRPLFNLRPGYLTFGAATCSGLRHFQADSHLISWLHAKGIEYDLVTDVELHNEGVAAVAGYKAVTTASHPEYHTEQSLNALQDYRDQGGNLLYLGGNGFYWRIAIHPENDSLLEIRRAEDGIRAWAAEPGEYYNAFDGNYGGLWRRNGRPPQALVGVGFAAQGEFLGDPYRRVCYDADYDWVFDGVTDELLGDFGFSGNGAAGFELDHLDYRLGTPEDTVLLAKSVARDDAFMLVPEEQLTHLTNLSGGPEKDVLHADMIYTVYPGGGSVFATGSITFCGSLPWNNFENNISRLLQNVMVRSLS
ncbi:MAG: hypothetical protein KTR32_19730, partial [Granulosicoccus sp.]|nr:hypothetical protein [Granulosicoccus sp.]